MMYAAPRVQIIFLNICTLCTVLKNKLSPIFSLRVKPRATRSFRSCPTTSSPSFFGCISKLDAIAEDGQLLIDNACFGTLNIADNSDSAKIHLGHQRRHASGTDLDGAADRCPHNATTDKLCINAQI